MNNNLDDDLYLEVNNTIMNKKKLKLYKTINSASIVGAGLGAVTTVSALSSDNIILASIGFTFASASVVANVLSKRRINNIIYDDVYKNSVNDNSKVIKK